MSVELPTEQHLEFLSLKGDRTGLSESTLVEMPHCWNSHVTAHFSYFQLCHKGCDREEGLDLKVSIIRLCQSACLILYTHRYRDTEIQIDRQNDSGGRAFNSKIIHHS